MFSSPDTSFCSAKRDIAIFQARGPAYHRVPRHNPPFMTVFIQQPVPGSFPAAPLSPSNSLCSSTFIAKSFSSFQAPIPNISCKMHPTLRLQVAGLDRQACSSRARPPAYPDRGVGNPLIGAARVAAALLRLRGLAPLHGHYWEPTTPIRHVPALIGRPARGGRPGRGSGGRVSCPSFG